MREWTYIETGYLRRFIREEVFPYRRPFPEGRRFEDPDDFKPADNHQHLMTVPLSVCDGELRYGQFKLILVDRPGLLWNVFRKPRKDTSFNWLFLPRKNNYLPSIVQRQAWWLYEQMQHNCTNHIDIFGTIGRVEKYTFRVFLQYRSVRCEDLESIIWERIWRGKGINSKAIRWGVRSYVRDKIKAKKKAGLIRIQEYHDQLDYGRRQDGDRKRATRFVSEDLDDPEYQQSLAESQWKEI